MSLYYCYFGKYLFSGRMSAIVALGIIVTNHYSEDVLCYLGKRRQAVIGVNHWEQSEWIVDTGFVAAIRTRFGSSESNSAESETWTAFASGCFAAFVRIAGLNLIEHHHALELILLEFAVANQLKALQHFPVLEV